MKTKLFYKVCQAAWPIVIYYLASGVVYFALGLILGEENKSYMLRQMICSAVTIPIIWPYYRQEMQIEHAVYGKHAFVWNRQQTENVLISLGAAATLGVALNNIIAMTPLMDVSDGFHQANEAFFGGNLVFEVLASCMIVPIAEELLFRGVVYKKLRVLLGAWPAIVFSALLFGIFHVNLVQFLYAGMLGLLLAFLVEKTGHLYTAILGHIAANGMAVLRQHTGWLDFSYQPDVAGIAFTVLMLLLGFALTSKLKSRECP